MAVRVRWKGTPDRKVKERQWRKREEKVGVRGSAITNRLKIPTEIYIEIRKPNHIGQGHVLQADEGIPISAAVRKAILTMKWVVPRSWD